MVGTIEILSIVAVLVVGMLILPIVFNENPAAFVGNSVCTIFVGLLNTTCNSFEGNVTFIGDFPIVITPDNANNTVTWSFGQLGNASHTNLGGGAEVFKNQTGPLVSLRTLVGDGGVTVIEDSETITIRTGGGGGEPGLQALAQGTSSNVVYNATIDGPLLTIVGDGITITPTASVLFSLNATVGRLNDVNTTDLDENQFLIYNVTTGNFENKPISALLKLADKYFNAEEATVDDIAGITCVNDVTYSFFDNTNIHEYRRQAIEFCPDSETDDNITWLYVVPEFYIPSDFKFRLFWTDDDTGAGSFMQRVNDDDDDCEESIGPINTGDVTCSSTDLEIHAENILEADDNDLIAMRWTNVLVPNGATIINATIQFHVDSTNPDEPIIVRLKGHDVDDSPEFTSVDFDISGRTSTTAFVDWDIPDWENTSDEGPAQLTPNLATIVQEIVDRPGWVEGNALTIKSTEWIDCTIISCPVNFGLRHAEAHDGESASAAELKIDFSTGGGGNPPVCFEISIMAIANTQLMDGDFTARDTVCVNRSGTDNLSVSEFTVEAVDHEFDPEDLVIIRIHRPNDFVAGDFESEVFVFGGELQWLN